MDSRAKLERGVRVEQFTQPGDPMRLDYPYRYSGTRGYERIRENPQIRWEAGHFWRPRFPGCVLEVFDWLDASVSQKVSWFFRDQ